MNNSEKMGLFVKIICSYFRCRVTTNHSLYCAFKTCNDCVIPSPLFAISQSRTLTDFYIDSLTLLPRSYCPFKHRSAFGNNVRVAYDLLNLPAPCRRLAEAPEVPDGSCSGSPTGGDGGSGGGGVRGGLYTQTLQCLCSEGGVPASTSAPLLKRLHCQEHEAVPYDVFRHGVLTCAVFSDYIRQAQRLYAEVCCTDEGPASRALCHAVLGTLKEALETSQGHDMNFCINANTKTNPAAEVNVKALRYLEASAKISPYKLAQAIAGSQTRGPGGNMDAKEFEDAAAELFITRVKVVS